MRLVVPAVVVAITVAALAGRAAADLASAAPPEELDPEAASSPTLAEMYEEWSAPGEHVRFETPNGPVHVWTPAGYVPETAITIVYVHGYAIDVDDAWLAHGLPEQFGASRVNAMFIASEAPADKLEPLRWTSPTALLEAVERELGRPVPSSRVIAIGHSGAYRTLERWVLDRKLGGIVLLDAGYASIVPFRDWARRSQAHRLIVVAHDTVHWSAVLRRYLPGMKSYYDGFAQFADPALLATARGHRLLDIRCDLGHWGIVNGGVALPTVLRLLHGVEASGATERPGTGAAPLAISMDTTHGDRLIEAMPEVTPDEIRYLEYVVSSIKQGLREADRGETISVDEAKARMRWRWRARHER